MIQDTDENVFSSEWIKANITVPIYELVILEKVIPWGHISKRLQKYYHRSKGPMAKPIRMMVALLIAMKLRGLSDRGVVAQVKENRYLHYFCQVPVKGLQTCMHPTSLVKFRQRLGTQGIAVIEQEVFDRLRRTGVIQGDDALIDSTVLENNIRAKKHDYVESRSFFLTDYAARIRIYRNMMDILRRHHTLCKR